MAVDHVRLFPSERHAILPPGPPVLRENVASVYVPALPLSYAPSAVQKSHPSYPSRSNLHHPPNLASFSSWRSISCLPPRSLRDLSVSASLRFVPPPAAGMQGDRLPGSPSPIRAIRVIRGSKIPSILSISVQSPDPPHLASCMGGSLISLPPRSLRDHCVSAVRSSARRGNAGDRCPAVPLPSASSASSAVQKSHPSYPSRSNLQTLPTWRLVWAVHSSAFLRAPSATSASLRFVPSIALTPHPSTEIAPLPPIPMLRRHAQALPRSSPPLPRLHHPRR
jgi:hypothetical protein